MRKILAFIVVALLALPASAGMGFNAATALQYERDLDSTSYEFCVLTGVGDDVLGGNRQVPIKIKTSGSSASTTENTASTNPFAFVAVGDELTVKQAGTNLGIDLLRYVATKTDAANITVNSAWNLSDGFTFSFRQLSCGTAAGSGWIPFNGFSSGTFVIDIAQLNVVGGIDYKIECRREGVVNSTVVMVTANKMAAFQGKETIGVNDRWDACRLGFKIGTADDGGDTGADAEKITAYFAGIVRSPQ